MLKNNLNIKFFLISFCLIILISLIFLYPSFFLAFSVDELDNLVKKDYPYLKGVFKPYGITLWSFNMFFELLGSNPLTFFVISFFLRGIASLSIVILVYQFTQNHLAAILSGLLFALSFSGIQTTSEPINMPVYLALTCAIIFILFFFLSRTKLQKEYLFLMGLSLLLATIISPIRINPIYFWALIVDSLWLVIYKSKSNLKKFVIRQFIIFSILIFLLKMGSFSYGLGENAFLKSTFDSINKIFISLSAGDFSIIFNILVGFGNVIFPNDYNFVAKNFNPGFNLFLGIGSILLLLISLVLTFKKKNENFLLLFSFLIWAPIFYLLIWIVSFSASSEVVVFSFRRYLLPAFIGPAISMGILISIIKKEAKNFYKITLFSIVLLLIFHSFSVLNFLNYLGTFSKGRYTEEIWQQIKTNVPSLPFIEERKMSVFYLELDGTPQAKYATDNAFSQRAALIYRIPQDPYRWNPNPSSTSSFEALVSYVKYGNDSNKIGFSFDQAGPITWDRIFAFRVEGNRLIDIKKDLKKRVEMVLDK